MVFMFLVLVFLLSCVGFFFPNFVSPCIEAVPKRILELMNVPGLTRENVASHLQVGIYGRLEFFS